MIEIRSGFQTGADIGGILAAKICSVNTGGWIPKGFRTENGNFPELAKFGAKETESYSYVPRTHANARDSDATIRFARFFDSRGEKCTLAGIKKHNKPYIDVDFDNPLPVEDVINWINENNIKILNVAGNSESKAPGIQEFVKKYMIKVIEGMRNGC